MRFAIMAVFGLLLAPTALAQNYDLVVAGGRVIDPETGLDAIRNVAIADGKIARVSADRLQGKRTIDAKGLVVAPGFIDLHQHGQTEESGRLKAFDGVTTGLEMEIGVPDVAGFLKAKESHSLINYGTTASHAAARARAFGITLSEDMLVPVSGPATNDPATQEQLSATEARLQSELDA